MKPIQLGKQLKELRTKFGYTQADISEFLGVDQSLISKYESGERQMSADTLEKLGDLYCCDFIHETSVGSVPLQVSFRASHIGPENMKAIQAVNRIVLNSLFMAELLREE